MAKRFGASFIAILMTASIVTVSNAQLPVVNYADYNVDGVVDCLDIDVWNWAFNIYSSDPDAYAAWIPILDLSTGPLQNNDGIVSRLDRHVLVREILGLSYGDANCDGVVDAADLTIVAINFGQSGMGWADGDFNGDGIVDEVDADAVDRNWLVVGNGNDDDGGVDDGGVIAAADLDHIDMCVGALDGPNCNQVISDLLLLEAIGGPWWITRDDQ